jgi:acetyl esterase
MSMKMGLRSAITALSLIGSASALTVSAGAFATAKEAAVKPYVRPDVQAYLDAMAKSPRPAMNEQTIAMIRKIPPAQIAMMMSGSEKPIGELAVDKAYSMPGPAGTIELRLFDAKAERAPGPVLVFYHGGGFVVGSIGTHAALAAEMARQLDVPVVSVEYRLAPEAKWPAAPDDAEAAARWIAANGTTFGRQFTGLILSGDSAGGTLTLVTALALRDKPASLPVDLTIPLYPMADASRTYPSSTAFGAGYGLNTTDTAFFERALAANKRSPRHSALLADLKGFPPTVLATASLDPLRDGGRAFAAKLVQAGVPVSFYEAEGTIHGYTTFRKAIPSAQGDLDTILAMARAMLAKDK